MNNHKGLDKLMKKLYVKEGYLANYGSDLLVAAFIVFMAICISSLIVVQSTIGQVRADWATNRCKPVYIPFAGWIMPQAGLSGADATAENMEFCFQSDFSSIANIILMPIQFIIFMMITAIDGVLTLASSVMDFMGNLEDDIAELWNLIYNMLLNFIIPFLVLFLHLRDAMAKLSGVLATIFWTLVNTYNLTVSGIINISEATITLLEVILLPAITIVIMIAFYQFWVGMALLLDPFTAPIGLTLQTLSVVMIGIVIIGLLFVYVETWISVVQLNTFIEQTFNSETKAPADPPSTNITSKHFKI